MPCWQVQSMSVQFRAEHADLLKKTLDNLGWHYRYDEKSKKLSINPHSDWDRIDIDLVNGVAKLRERVQGKLNELKRAYSATALEVVADKRNWKLDLKQKPTGLGAVGSFAKTYI